MKKFKFRHAYLLFTLFILSVFFITGCGGGEGTGHWLPGGTTAPPVVPDTIRPRVLSTIPANLAVVAPINAAITAIFTKNMAPATITAGATFTVRETVSGLNVPGNPVTYDAGSRTATFTPTANLIAGLNYTATITTAATDLAGNALAGNQAPLAGLNSHPVKRI